MSCSKRPRLSSHSDKGDIELPIATDRHEPLWILVFVQDDPARKTHDGENSLPSGPNWGNALTPTAVLSERQGLKDGDVLLSLFKNSATNQEFEMKNFIVANQV